MNRIRLSKLTLKNFGIFKDTSLDFDGKDVVGILAEYENDKTRSNRSGKSLILESIKYLLIGTTRAKRNVNMIHHGEESMLVTGIFIDDEGKTYKIRRGVDSKGTGVLELDWIEKTTESQKAIEDLFGVSKEDFELTSFFKQADINGFMDLSPADKSKYLMQSMDITHWKVKYDLVMDDVKVYTERLRDNEAVKKALEASLENSDDLEMLIRDLKTDIEKLEKKKAKIGKALDEANKQMAEEKNSLKNKRTEIKNLKDKIEEVSEKREQVKNWKVTYSKLKKGNEELKSKLVDLPDRDAVVTEVADLKNKRSQLIEKRRTMKENNGGICPILKSSCSLIESTQEDFDKIESELEKIAKVLSKKEDIVLKHKKQQDMKELVSSNANKMERLKDRIKNFNEQDSIEEDKSRIKELEEQLEDNLIGEIEAKTDTILEDFSEVDTQLMLGRQKMGGLEQRAKQAKDALAKIDEVTEQNEKLKTVLGDLRFISGMFSKNGIAANEIENAFSTIEDECNMLLKELDYGPTLVFSPDKELTKWEPICHCGFKFPKGYRSNLCDDCGSLRMKQRKEEISLKILENGVEKEFGMDSGGGKLIVSFVVRLALTMYKRRQNKCKLNMIFLDEVDSALDAHLASAITDAITKVLTKRLGFDQIFMISHKDEIKNSVPHILKVTRRKTYSTAEFI